MCGIVGYVGHRDCREVLIDGLRRLEYRGYDSAGLAWLSSGRTTCIRRVGRPDSLVAALGSLDGGSSPAPTSGMVADRPSIGIGHARWATDGTVNECSAHPHGDESGRVGSVLNGIIENRLQLRPDLVAEGLRFSSETDRRSREGERSRASRETAS